MALIFLGWELRASYITVLCVQTVMMLSPLPSLYSHSTLKKFYITCITSILPLLTTAYHINCHTRVHPPKVRVYKQECCKSNSSLEGFITLPNTSLVNERHTYAKIATFSQHESIFSAINVLSTLLPYLLPCHFLNFLGCLLNKACCTVLAFDTLPTFQTLS